MRQQRLLDGVPAQLGVEERFSARAQTRQNWLQPGHQHAEHVQPHGADCLQVGVAAFLFGYHPRRLLVNIAVSDVGQRHNFADGFTELAAFPRFADSGSCIGEGFIQRRVSQFGGEHPVEALIDKAGVTRSQVHHFVNDIGVNALDKVFQVQVDIINARRELSGVVVAQAVGVEMVQPGAGFDKGTA